MFQGSIPRDDTINVQYSALQWRLGREMRGCLSGSGCNDISGSSVFMKLKFDDLGGRARGNRKVLPDMPRDALGLSRQYYSW